MPYGGSVTISDGLRSPRSRATSSALVAVAAQHAVLAAEPQIAEAGHRVLWKRRSGVGLSSSSGVSSRSSISFGSKPVRLRSKSAALSSCNSRASSSSSQSAQVTERFTIRRNAFTCASVHSSQRITGISVMTQLARGLQPQMAIDHLAVAAGQHRDLEAELPDAAAHAIDRGVVLAGIACVEDQLVDRPDLNFGWIAVL